MRDDGKEYVSHEEIILLGGFQGCQNAQNFYSRIPRSARLVDPNPNLTDDHQNTAVKKKQAGKVARSIFKAIRSFRWDINYRKISCFIPLDTKSIITLLINE